MIWDSRLLPMSPGNVYRLFYDLNSLDFFLIINQNYDYIYD